MRAFSYVWSLPVMWQTAVRPTDLLYLKTTCYMQTSWLYVLQKRSYWRNRDFQHLLLLWPWPWPDDLHIPSWPVFPGDNWMWEYTNFLRQCFRLTDIQTDMTEIIYHTALRVLKKTSTQVTQASIYHRPNINTLCSSLCYSENDYETFTA